jgi:hypothetical protein
MQFVLNRAKLEAIRHNLERLYGKIFEFDVAETKLINEIAKKLKQ